MSISICSKNNSVYFVSDSKTQSMYPLLISKSVLGLAL
jgi:hypothetical protein